MVPVTGVGSLGEPLSTRSLRSRDRYSTDTQTRPKDGVQISPEAREAASVARALHEVASQSEIRAQRVEAAKENIRQGSYRIQEVVYQVAARITEYV